MEARPELAAVQLSVPIARGARVTLRLLPEDKVLLGERAAARGMPAAPTSRPSFARINGSLRRYRIGSLRRCERWSRSSLHSGETSTRSAQLCPREAR